MIAGDTVLRLDHRDFTDADNLPVPDDSRDHAQPRGNARVGRRSFDTLHDGGVQFARAAVKVYEGAGCMGGQQVGAMFGCIPEQFVNECVLGAANSQRIKF